MFLSFIADSFKKITQAVNLNSDFLNILIVTFAISLIIFIGLLLNYFIFKLIFIFIKKNKNKNVEMIYRIGKSAGKVLFPLFIFLLLIPFLKFSEELKSLVQYISSGIIIISLTWISIRSIMIAKNMLIKRYGMNTANNLKARKIVTQYVLLEKVIIAGILIISASSFLMIFPAIRQFGVSLLASAGVLGIIVGVAAQKNISNIVSGIQIALTQPIRIDDVVFVEDEWGRIEEINLTYIVVKIWDSRRLVLPISYFIDKPFENWTKSSSELLGTVFVYVDYLMPVEVLRKELQNIVRQSEHWDRRVCLLQVTKLTEKTVELRILISAEDSSRLWDLRCFVRDKILYFIQNNYPGFLPVTRVELKK